MRIWNSTGKDEGSRHAIGNGDMLVYGIGPNIESLFGPPYSSPPILRMLVETDGGPVRCESVREPGTAVWRHRIMNGEDGSPSAELTDFMLPARNVFVRDFKVEAGVLTFRVTPASKGVRQCPTGHLVGGAFAAQAVLLSDTRGPEFLPYDPVTEEVDVLLAASGNVRLAADGEGIAVVVGPGTGRLVFSAGTRLPDQIRDTEDALADAGGRLLAETREHWRRFAARRPDFAAMIPARHPVREAMLDAIDSVAVLIKCQQSASGGIVPGHRYSAMAYVRDMAGAMRGLLALGYAEEAKAVLRFWLRKWERFGNLQNAEGMGDDSVRLSGGNNEVEIPAYVVLCSFDYYAHTGDEAFLEELLPMLDWAMAVQLPHLAGGMTEFSNDETYIAGGVFPRHLMFQGSAESTLMFVTGGARFLDWAARRGLLPEEKLRAYRQAVDEAARLYRGNFLPDGVLYANNPERERLAGKPRFQFGFCDAHGRDGQLVNRWIELQEQGYYLCAACKGRPMPDPGIDETKRYALNSVNFLPVYYGSGLLSPEEIASIVQPGFDLFAATGRIPSDLDGDRALGYDCGLMLYSAVKLGDPIAERLLRKALGLLDPAGAWAEYYDGDAPAECCRARPWESGINIEGVVAYILSIHREGRA